MLMAQQGASALDCRLLWGNLTQCGQGTLSKPLRAGPNQAEVIMRSPMLDILYVHNQVARGNIRGNEICSLSVSVLIKVSDFYLEFQT